MSRRVVINNDTGRIENIILLDDGVEWASPEGCTVLESEDAGNIGDVWDGESFVTPEPEPEDESDLRLGELIGRLKADTMTLKEMREFLRAMYGLDTNES